MKQRMSDVQRFFSYVTISPTGCWLWTGGHTTKHYGKFWYMGRLASAHRVAYFMFRGDIPEGKQIDHLCRVHECVNPNHLEAVTARENIMRGETRAANNAAKTHCPVGHPYTVENTYVDPKNPNRRHCRACWPARNARSAEYRRAYYKKRSHQTKPSGAKSK